jgi:hypothetical protein
MDFGTHSVSVFDASVTMQGIPTSVVGLALSSPYNKTDSAVHAHIIDIAISIVLGEWTLRVKFVVGEWTFRVTHYPRHAGRTEKVVCGVACTYLARLHAPGSSLKRNTVTCRPSHE